MKEGTAYATRLKKAYAEHRQSAPKPDLPAADDPLRRLAIAILAVSSSDAEAEHALDRALSSMAGWNEIRVSSAEEVYAAIGNRLADGLQHCRRLIDALNDVYDRENRLSLDRLKGIGRREARQYLEGLSGVDEYAVASVLLWSLGGHGIPVNDALWKALRDAHLVHPGASRGEVQAFLERHVSAADARDFCVVMQSFAPKKNSDRKTAAPKLKSPAAEAARRKKT